MRIGEEQAGYLAATVRKILPNADVRLFGSRANDRARGGDIDILVVGDRRLTYQEKGAIKVAFWKRFGEQKLDVVSFAHTDRSSFKDVVVDDAIVL